jgi:hypothetical protein
MKKISFLLFANCFYFGLHLPAQQSNGSIYTAPQSLCAIVENANFYDKKEIVVLATYRMYPHGALLEDSSCPESLLNLRESASFFANKLVLKKFYKMTKNNQYQPVKVVFRGILHVAETGMSFGEFNTKYEFETLELISVDESKVTASK